MRPSKMVEGWVREDGSLSKGLKGLSDDSKTGHVDKSSRSSTIRISRFF